MAVAATPTAVLANIPTGLRTPLLDEFNKIVRNFRESKWEPAELDGGRFCEVVYSIIRGHADGTFPPAPTKPRNFPAACTAMEQLNSTTFPHSIRITMPRCLIALYEIRNNRGVGHVGGDVNANHMDAVVVLHVAKWVLAELVRIFHNVSTAQATIIVDQIVDRTIQVVWHVGEMRRSLNTKLSMKDRTLLLLYGEVGAVNESDLFEWVEHSNSAIYRRDVLRRCHKEKLIEYNEKARTIHISPLGIKHVETNVPMLID